MGSDSFFQHVAFEVGEGNQIRFWYDLWSGDLPLKDLHPDLFECSKEDKEALVFNMLQFQIKVRCWNLQIHKDFHDWVLKAAYFVFDHNYYQMPRGEGVGKDDIVIKWEWQF